MTRRSALACPSQTWTVAGMLHRRRCIVIVAAPPQWQAWRVVGAGASTVAIADIISLTFPVEWHREVAVPYPLPGVGDRSFEGVQDALTAAGVA